MIWTLQATDNAARAGILRLNGREIHTPIFMPVGTQACVKALDFNDLSLLRAPLILANTYHLYLRPGAKIIEKLGGLRGFSGFSGSFLTDSGGFQAFSLKGRAKEDGVAFKSHIDGGSHFFTPELVLDIQYALNSDIMMILDDLVALPNERARIAESIRRTVAWARRSLQYHAAKIGGQKTEGQNTTAQKIGTRGELQNEPQNKIFAIIQGGTDAEFRRICAGELTALECQNNGQIHAFDGFAIGGLAVGEEKGAMLETIALTTQLMPRDKPRYLMGVGTPEDLVEGIYRGVDMFDCVMPTRNARNGTLFTHFGRLSIKSPRFSEDSRPIDERCGCYACQNFSRAYLNHLFRAKETLYFRLSSIHNLHYYLDLVRAAREAILAGGFEAWRREFYARRG